MAVAMATNPNPFQPGLYQKFFDWSVDDLNPLVTSNFRDKT